MNNPGRRPLSEPLIQSAELFTLDIWLILERAPDGIHVPPLECTCPLHILDKTDGEHQDRSQHDKEPVVSNSFVQNIACSEDLNDENLQVTQPELVILQGIGSYAVRTA